MTWISLASNRYKLRDILKFNRNNSQRKKMRYEVIDSQLGLYALLSGNEFHIKREIELAEFLVSNYVEKKAPPFQILSDVIDLVIIADLGKTDYTEIFDSIAKSKAYKQDFEKSLRLIAQRIVRLEKIPDKRRLKKGHIASEKSWLRLVAEYNPEQTFSLAVTLEHPNSYILKKFILPLAFLLSKNQAKKDRHTYLRQILSWGATNIEEKKNIVYERIKEPPNIEAILNSQGKSYGFDAVELKDDEVVAYYYFGENPKVSQLFNKESDAQYFFEKISNDWNPLKNSINSKVWSQINALKEEYKCRYVFIYDTENVSFPEKIFYKIANQSGLEVVTKDITEV